MGVFKMLEKTGEHVERDAGGHEVTYKAGDTLESKADLVALFQNKFVRLDVEPVPGGNVPQPTVPIPHLHIKEPVSPSTTDEKELDVAETPTEPVATGPETEPKTKPDVAETPTEPEVTEPEDIEK